MASINQAALKYPFDRTGTATTNKIVNEERSVGVQVYRALAPYAGSFYSKSMVVTDATTGTALVLNTDYKLAYPNQEAELATGLPVCTVVFILNSAYTDVYLSYQAVGGPYTTSNDVLAQMITDIQADDTAITWDAILGKPTEFNPTKHTHSATDLYGLEYVVLALEELVQAVYTGDVSAHDVLYDYINRIKTSVDTAVTDFNNGIADVKALIDALTTRLNALTTTVSGINDTLTAHIADTSNPHEVTKDQVGLGLVNNYRIATQPEAEAGTASNVYMTALTTNQAIAKYTALNITPTLTSHIQNTSNPHKVTSAQVGLGNVLNVPQVQQGGGTGMSNNKIYLGWDGSKMLLQVDSTAMGTVFTTSQPDPTLTNHVANTNNPHGVTKSQVGLGSVNNFGISSEADGITGTRNDVYVTPYTVAAYANSFKTISTSAPPSSTSGYRGNYIWYQII